MAGDALRLPDPSLVVLVGPSASGKSTWAEQHFVSAQIVSSDHLRAVVGSGEDDLSASADAFALLERIVAIRLAKRLTTVVDTLGFDAERRAQWLDLARRSGVHAVLVVFDASPRECKDRNAGRAKRVPARVIDHQLRTYAELRPDLENEGFAEVLEAVAVRVVARQFVPSTPRAQPGEPSAGADSAAPTRLTFGLHIPQFTFPGGPSATATHLREIAAAAENAGFTALYVMDHFRQIPQVGRAWEDMLECFTTLTWLAAATERVRVGSLVAAINHRTIPLLGKTIATLDVLSGGRAMCGLGLGWFTAEQRALGLDLPPIRKRYEFLEDALRFLPLLWGAGAPAFDGHHLHVREALCYPRPLQARIPIMVGGNGERRTLPLVARYGDACNLFGQPDDVAHKVRVLASMCTDAGRTRGAVAVTHLSTVLVVTAEVGGARPRRGRGIEINTGTVEDHQIRFDALHASGVTHAIVSLADLNSAEGGIAAIERFRPLIDAFAFAPA